MPLPLPIMDLAPGDQIWQLRAQWSYSGFGLAESSWSFIDSVLTEDGAESLYLLWQAEVEPLYCAARPDAWELTWVIVEDRYPATRPPLVVHYIPGLRPDSSGKGCAPQVSGLISWRTGHPGRSYRGRTFWGPVRVADMESEGFIGGDARAAMSDFADGMFATLGYAALLPLPRFVIVSRTADGAPRVTPQYTTPIFANIVRYAKTIRKRDDSPTL